MIYYAKYDTVPGQGLSLICDDPRFPSDVMPELRRVSEQWGEVPSSPTAAIPALRLAPLGSRFLLTIVNRIEDTRSYNRLIHILMDKADLELLVTRDWHAVYRRASDMAFDPVTFPTLDPETLSASTQPMALQKENTFLACCLMAGAAFPDSSEKVQILNSSPERLPMDCLNWLYARLPKALYGNVSFNTNTATTAEGNGVKLMFSCGEPGRGSAAGELADILTVDADHPQEQPRVMQSMRGYLQMAVELLSKNIEQLRIGTRLLGQRSDFRVWHALCTLDWTKTEESLRRLVELVGAETAECELDELYAAAALEGLVSRPPVWLKKEPVLLNAMRQRCAMPKPGLFSRKTDPSLPQQPTQTWTPGKPKSQDPSLGYTMVYGDSADDTSARFPSRSAGKTPRPQTSPDTMPHDPPKKSYPPIRDRKVPSDEREETFPKSKPRRSRNYLTAADWIIILLASLVAPAVIVLIVLGMFTFQTDAGYLIIDVEASKVLLSSCALIGVCTVWGALISTLLRTFKK